MRSKCTSLALVLALAAASGYVAEGKEGGEPAGKGMPLCEKHRAEFAEKHKQREGENAERRAEHMEKQKEQEAENKAFAESLKSMSPEEQKAAIQARMKARYEEELSNIKARYEEAVARMKEHFAANTNLTQAQKDEKLAAMEKHYQEMLARAKARYDEKVAMYNATPEEREAMRKKHQEQMKEHQAKMAERRKENESKAVGHGQGKEGDKCFCVMCEREAREAEKAARLAEKGNEKPEK